MYKDMYLSDELAGCDQLLSFYECYSFLFCGLREMRVMYYNTNNDNNNNNIYI